MKPADAPGVDADLANVAAAWLRASGRTRVAARIFGLITGENTSEAAYRRRREAALKRFQRRSKS